MHYSVGSTPPAVFILVPCPAWFVNTKEGVCCLDYSTAGTHNFPTVLFTKCFIANVKKLQTAHTVREFTCVCMRDWMPQALHHLGLEGQSVGKKLARLACPIILNTVMRLGGVCLLSGERWAQLPSMY